MESTKIELVALLGVDLLALLANDALRMKYEKAKNLLRCSKQIEHSKRDFGKPIYVSGRALVPNKVCYDLLDKAVKAFIKKHLTD